MGRWLRPDYVATAITEAAIDVAVNAGFEAADVSGWVEFPTVTSTFGVTGDANSGSFAGVLSNATGAVRPSGLVVKNANIGVGTVLLGMPIKVSFAAKGNFIDGGVGIAAFFCAIGDSLK